MTNKINIIIDLLSHLTLLEGKQLIVEIEKYFNIITFSETNIQNGNINIIESSKEKIKEEQVSFNLFLNEVPADKKITILKLVRSITGLGLKESKDIVDNIPKLIKENLSKEESTKLKKEFEDIGAKVELK